LVTRFRSIAEHALTPDSNDPLGNTRTTVASWWERLLLAPNRVNYHLEHHLLMTVPHYNLPRMHRMMRERGLLDRACVEHGYWKVLTRAASKPMSGLDTGDRADDDRNDLPRLNGFLQDVPDASSAEPPAA
jgi:fatty acid desaturase